MQLSVKKFSGPRGEMKMGGVDEVKAEEIAFWRNMTVQQRADEFVALMRIWKADAPGLAQTFTITTVPRS
jgi:hypothetical protein